MFTVIISISICVITMNIEHSRHQG